MTSPVRLCLLLCAWTTSVCVYAQPLPIRVGFTSTLSGPQAAYGQGLLHGARLAARRANAAGGIAGRPIDLVVLDDTGDPQRAAANARELLDSGAVALIGVHGARTAAAVAATLVTNGGNTPLAALLAPSSGADSLRYPSLPGVFHLRAGAAEEASAAVLHLDTVGTSTYALISQDDALGASGHERLMVELTRIAIRPIANVRVAVSPRGLELKRVVAEVCAARPEALVLAVDATTASLIVEEGKKQRCAAQYLVFSETGAALAAQEPSANGRHPLAGVLVTQVVPHPNNNRHPIVAEYQRALAAQNSSGSSYPSVEGYLIVRVLQETLSTCVRDISRTCLLRILRSNTLELPGLRVHFGEDQRQSRPFVEITLLDDQGRFLR